jgi:hypothetical protein
MIIEIENRPRKARKGELVLRSREGRPVEVSPAAYDFEFLAVIVRRVLSDHDPDDRTLCSGHELDIYDAPKIQQNGNGTDKTIG